MEKLVKIKKLKRKRKHGFMARKSNHNGQKMLKRRRQSGRTKLAA